MVISSNIIIPVFTHIPFSPFTVHAIYKDNYGYTLFPHQTKQTKQTFQIRLFCLFCLFIRNYCFIMIIVLIGK